MSTYHTSALALGIAAITIAFPTIAHEWTPLPWVNEQTLDDPAVTFGGEGAQWPQALASDMIDGSFVLYGTDVGGLFRSLDGGDTWEPCNVGFTPRGTSAVAIDPRNPKRVLAVGSNSTARSEHGLYLSIDQAASWQHVQPARIGGYRDFRDQITFDPSSYDADLGYCTDVYWSRLAIEDRMQGDPEIAPAIYKSTDGGATWHIIPGSQPFAGGHLHAHPIRRGFLYASCPQGVAISTDGGATFEIVHAGSITGLAVSPAAPFSVWISTPTHIEASHDQGKTWQKLPTTGMDQASNGRDESPGVQRRNVRLEHLTVSPLEPNRLAVRSIADNWRWRLHTSRDGGQTWSTAQFDNAQAILPHNNRKWIVRWHPTQPDTAWSFGGDWATITHDGGKTFRWASDGINGVRIGGLMQFSYADPDVVFAAAQDYNSAFTTDGGTTWRYCNVSGNSYGGHIYGGYALDAKRIVAGHSPKGWNSDRVLRSSFDGGKTWTQNTEPRWSTDTASPNYGFDASHGSPIAPDLVFSGRFRSHDGGRTWETMVGCRGVFTASNAAPYTLFGVDIDASGRCWVVSSEDQGSTWSRIDSFQNRVTDLAYDHDRDRLYIAVGGTLVMRQDGQLREIDTPRDQFNSRQIEGVAVDPNSPAVVYATQRRNVYAMNASALRSTDAGQTWEILTRQKPLDGVSKDGARESFGVRVHPETREAWFITSCYGIWKISPPESK
ncbi:MAG: hypothetical protein AAF823_11380 [Planctomycetota bacterium]